MHVVKLMKHPVITCTPGDTLAEAARLMWEHDCGVLPVVGDDGRVTGILTDRDICMAAFTKGLRLEEIHVHAAMAIDVVTVAAEDSVGAVERLMITHQLRRLPVVDSSERPIGMISLSDLARESAAPDSRMKHPAKVMHALAAISFPRTRD
jgi:CBS domain-containing protein